MKTLQVHNGDLVLGAHGYATVAGATKLRQDLGLAVREPYGCDRFHPQWGSLLPSYVGGPVGIETEALVKGEITRIIQNHASQQAALMQDDLWASKASQFLQDEAIDGITRIDVAQYLDRVTVAATVKTMSGAQIVTTANVRGTE